MSNTTPPARGSVTEIEKPFRLRTLRSLIEDHTPTMNGQGCYLRSRAQLAALNDLIANVTKGSMVRVFIEATRFKEKCPESPWVIVEQARGKNAFTGFLNSRMGRSQFHGLKMGDAIEFRREHIVDIWIKVEGKTQVPLGDNIPESAKTPPDLNEFFGKKPKGSK